MRAHRSGRTKRARRLGIRAHWPCLLAGLLVIAGVSRFGERGSSAQSTSSTADGAPVPARPYPEQVNPAPANVAFIANPAMGSSSEAIAVKSPSSEPAGPGLAAAPGPAPAPVPSAKQKELDAITDPQKREIIDQSANLLKLANSLKAEMDKTGQDTLSVAVVRQADEIEKLAHKMRTK